jgi:Co/Zn/Cd efflux system component
LLKSTGSVLLDRQGPDSLRRFVRRTLEGDSDDRVCDLHVWSIGPGLFAAEVGLVTHHPKEPSLYKTLLMEEQHLVHVTVEVHRCTPL